MNEPSLSDTVAHWLEERGLIEWVLYESGGTVADITERGRLAVLGHHDDF